MMTPTTTRTEEHLEALLSALESDWGEEIRETAAIKLVKFANYYEANPQVFDLLIDKAHWASEHGYPSVNITFLFELVRLDPSSDLSGERTIMDDQVKLPNEYKPYLARLLKMFAPGLGYIDTKAIKNV